MNWVMQYRTRRDEADQWGDWGDLPKTLLFSDIYTPHQFEFRCVEKSGDFIFRMPPQQ